MPAGLPSPAYYQRFIGCVDYLRLTTAGNQRQKQLVDLVFDRDAHDTLAFCDDDDAPT